ncbi:ATP synthase F0F1 subunit C [Pontibacillus chungwhensis BH030062]|uniref:ATP synthase F0F1 subunit C n=1 Tax=Pontibacillus chungwhensis BH030062 TaxID=1385513 RepID=A0A0A2UYN6_9BACI|nr:hypothetical protein [Pontibacillus chungwhensis]KGP91858.1 ATP synthase F0F1 subunit C [Pontibacillus chungwhensis BH030062]
MDPIYFFVIAVLIATGGISFISRKALYDVAQNPDNLQSIQTKLFIGVAVVEVIPIVLIVFGFINLDQSTIDPVTPLILVAIITFINGGHVFKTYLSLTGDADKQAKEKLRMLFMVCLPLLMAFPIIAGVATMTTTGS